MRARWRSVTDQAASSKSGRALTSTNTRSLRRRATMSSSPTGLFHRRARMRKPLAMRNAAARLSAEMPVRNAILLLSCPRAGDALIGRSSRAESSVIFGLHAQRKRALIDEAARRAGQRGDFAHRLLDREPTKRRSQDCVEIVLGNFVRRRPRNHNDNLPAHICLGGIVARERGKIAAPDLFMHLRELAANCGLPWAKCFRQVGQRGRQTGACLKEDEGRRNRFERGDAHAPRGLLWRQKALE